MAAVLTLSLALQASASVVGSSAGAADVNRGVREARLGRVEKALRFFARATSRNPALAEAHLNRGLLLAQQGRHSEAQSFLRRALALDPDMPEALEGMALSLLLENRNAAAAAAYERALVAGSRGADTYFNLAIARARLGERGPAARACREALRIRPDMAKAQALLVEIGE